MSRATDDTRDEAGDGTRHDRGQRPAEQPDAAATGSVQDARPGAAHCRPARAPAVDILCPVCGIEMQPEHAHYRCPQCGYRDSCCF